MNAISSSPGRTLAWQAFVIFLCALTLTCCTENESQVQELRLLREKLTLAEKKLEANTTVESQKLADSVQKLLVAEARISSLEKKLLEAPSPSSPAANVTVVSVRTFAEAMKNDLAEKVGELCQSVEQAVPQANLQGFNLTRLPPLENIAASYESKITFLVVSGGMTRQFPFQIHAGLDGQWQLPVVEVIKRQINDFLKLSEAQKVSDTHNDVHKSAPLPLPKPNAAPVRQDPPPRQKEQRSGRLFIQWTDPEEPTQHQNAASKVKSAPASQPAKPLLVEPRLQPNTAAPIAPPLIMPVVEDVQIRFKDL